MFLKQPMSDVIQKGFQPLAQFCSKSGEKRKNKVLLQFVKELWLLNDRHRMFLKHPMSDVSDLIQNLRYLKTACSIFLLSKSTGYFSLWIFIKNSICFALTELIKPNALGYIYCFITNFRSFCRNFVFFVKI